MYYTEYDVFLKGNIIIHLHDSSIKKLMIFFLSNFEVSEEKVKNIIIIQYTYIYFKVLNHKYYNLT